jgi:hypothetical protein
MRGSRAKQLRRLALAHLYRGMVPEGRARWYYRMLKRLWQQHRGKARIA